MLLNSPSGWEVEQPWLWWTGPANGNGALGPIGHPIPGASPTAGFASIPAVARATNLLTKLATLPWHVYRNDTERITTPDWIADPQALRVDERIVDGDALHDCRLSGVDLWGQWILSASWYGDGFVWVPQRDTSGAPKPPFFVLHPLDVEVRDGSYYVGDVVLPPSSVIHLRSAPPIVNGRGTGVLDRFVSELGLAASLREYVAGAFTAGVPAGYLKTTTPNLSQDQADALKARWLSQHGGLRRSIAVLSATTEFHPLTWSPVDLAAVDFARITVQQIALMFDEPAYLLGAPTDSNTYANVDSRMLELYQLTYLDWIARIEAVLDAQFPRGTELRVEIDGLLRADIKTRYEAYEKGYNIGALTVNEIRELENRPPLDQEDVA